jgi:putative transposase
MGSVGDAYDNAITESFFATLECELLDRHRFRTRTQARMAIFDYLEGFYRGRDRPCGRPPAQIPACAANALGS